MEIADVIELRVHGVSGTPPEELLDRPLVRRVAGDATAGFYRPRLDAERTDSWPAGVADPVVTGPELEGYAWGGLTSGAPSRAFWLLLLPFTLVNVAPRLRPADPDPDPDGGGPTRAAAVRLQLLWLVCRLLALTLTVVLVMAFAGIGVDLVGWQCDPAAGRCAQASHGGVTAWVIGRSTPHRLLIGAALPLLAVAALWWISHRTARQYERVPVSLNVADATSGPVWDAVDRVDAVEVGLRSRWMWDNDEPVQRLRAVHVQVGIATVLGVLSAVLAAPWEWLDGGVAVAVAAYAVVAVARRSFTSHEFLPGWRIASVVAWCVLGAASAATAAWLLLNARALDRHLYRCMSVPAAPPAHPTAYTACRPAGELPRYGDTLLWLLFVELLLVLALLGVVAWARGAAGHGAVMGTPGPPVALGGFGAVALALMGVFLASAFTAGLYLYAAAWLNTGSLKPGLSEVAGISRRFSVPEAVVDAALAFTVSVGILALTLVGVGLWVWHAYRTMSPTTPPIAPGAFDSDYPAQPGPPDAARRTTVLRALWLGRLVDLAPPLLGGLMCAGAVLSFGFAGVLFAEHVLGARRAARWLLNPADPRHPERYRGVFSPSYLQGLGGYLVIVFVLLLVGLGAAAFRVGPTRRSVGILWDLASFWPRLAHPLAAPCYAERTVPDLLTRIRSHAASGRGIVLAGHSQGSVISAAVVLQLRTDDELTPGTPALPRLGLLTFGCVLRRLYGRFFPAYFGAAAMAELRAALPRHVQPDDVQADVQADDDQRWRNLWRYTDYLGGPVTSGPPPAVQPVWNPSGPDPDPVGPGGLRLDLHLVDPVYATPPGDTVAPSPLRHSAYWTVPEYQYAVVRVARLI